MTEIGRVIQNEEEYYPRYLGDKYIKGINAGIGLTNMEERVKSLSGIINFSFENGFRIFISVPKEV